MNMKSIFGTVTDVLGGITGKLGSLVGVAIMSQIVLKMKVVNLYRF